MKNMMYVTDNGNCIPFSTQGEMIDAIERNTKPQRFKINTQQKLGVQQVIANAIKERGGGLYEDNGEIMDGHVKSILAILGLELE